MSKPQAHPPQTTGDSGACQPKSPPVSGISNAVYVAVGILCQADGRVLLGSRPVDKPWAHWWELPGGKIEPHETARQALARELDEELGIQIELSHTQHWHRLPHRYPSGWVVLDFFLITKWRGTPKALEGQSLAWVQPHHLGDVGPVLPATLPVLRWLQLPQYYLISSAYGQPEQWLQRLKDRLQAQQLKQTPSAQPSAQDQPSTQEQQGTQDQQGTTVNRPLPPGHGNWWVQFREPAWQQQAKHDAQAAQSLYACFQQTVALCAQYGVRCLVNSVHPQQWWAQAHGLHLRSHDARKLAHLDSHFYAVQAHFDLPAGHFVAVSTHNDHELQLAKHLQADCAVLGHVLATPSHPDAPALGWGAFEQLIKDMALPVYALGGQSPQTLPTALQHGAQGIAGIRNLL